MSLTVSYLVQFLGIAKALVGVKMCWAFLAAMIAALPAHSSAPQFPEPDFLTQLENQPVVSVYVDSYSFLWVSTLNGLFRFDGVGFIEEVAYSAPITPFAYIIEDSMGNIIAATDGNTLAKLDRQSGSLTRISIPDSSIQALLASERGETYLLSEKSIYLIGENLNLNKIVPASGGFKYSEIFSEASQFLEKKLFVTGSEVIYQLDFDQSYTSPEIQAVAQFKLDTDDDVSSIHATSNGLILLGTTKGVLKVIEPSGSDIVFPDQHLINDLSSITDIIESREWIWVATDNGLARFKKDLSNGFIHKTTNSAITNNHVIDLFIKKENLFVGNFQGLNIVRDQGAFSTFNNKNSLVDNEVMDIAQCPDGTIYVATYSGLYKREVDATTHERIETHTSDLIGDQRFMNLSCQNDRLILGTRRNGIVFGNLQKNTFKAPSEFSDLQITQVVDAKNGTLWFSTFSKGVFKVTEHSTENYQFIKAEHDSPQPPVFVLTEDTRGRIYAATDNGIFLYDERANSFRRIELEPQKRVLVVLPEGDNILWLGLQNGGLIVARKSDDQEIFDLENVFSESDHQNVSVYAIEKDHHGNIWASSSNGLFRLEMPGAKIVRFDETDGLQGSGFNFHASMVDRQGKIYFGGSKGYSVYNPAFENSSRVSPRIYLSEIRILGERVVSDVPLYLLEEVHLNYKDHSISLGFGVIDFLSPADNQYRYKLQGFDPDWIDAGSRNFTTYTNLPAGEYTFRVQGADSMGVWNRDGLSLLITKEASPWLRWWAWLAYATVILVMAWFIRRHFTQVIVAREAKKRVEEVNAAADIAIDELHEQLEYQRELISAAQSHSLHTLAFIADLIKSQGAYRFDDRIASIQSIERNIAYQADVLLVDFYQVGEELIQAALPKASVQSESITTINRIEVRHLPVNTAVPLALVLSECLYHSLTRAFKQESLANFIEIRLTESTATTGTSQNLCFTFIDNGSASLSENGQQDSNREFSLVSLVCHQHEWNLAIYDEEGERVEVLIPKNWND